MGLEVYAKTTTAASHLSGFFFMPANIAINRKRLSPAS